MPAAAVALAGCPDRGEAPPEAVEEAVAAAPGPPPGNLPPGVTAEEAEVGRRTYRETCVVCHGEQAEGTQLGPPLVDREWRLGDGSYEHFVQVVGAGVPEPEEFPVPMPPGAEIGLDQGQVRAVAAYAWSLSRPD